VRARIAPRASRLYPRAILKAEQKDDGMASAQEIANGKANEASEVRLNLAKCSSMNFYYKTYQGANGQPVDVTIGAETGDGGTKLKKEAVDKALKAIIKRGFVLPDLTFYFSTAAGVPCVAYMPEKAGAPDYTVFMGPKTGQHNPQVNKSPGLKGGMGQSGMRGVADQVYDGTHRWFGNPKMHAHASCVVIHELGHVLHDLQSSALFWDFKLSRPAANGGWLNNAMKVSHYATTNPLEMVAETFAGVMCGKTYNGAVGTSYQALGGPQPANGAFP
jgi:hypothetical protein